MPKEGRPRNKGSPCYFCYYFWQEPRHTALWVSPGFFESKAQGKRFFGMLLTSAMPKSEREENNGM